MRGANSFRRLISKGRSLAVLGAFLLSTLVLSVVPVIPSVHAEKSGPLLSAHESIQPLGDLIPWVYIPIIMNGNANPAGIYGYVTQSGTPAAGVSLILYLKVGDNDSLITTSNSDANGYFSFTGVPGISSGTGQGYFVRFSIYSGNNGTVPGRLNYWNTRILQSYTKDQVVNIGNFDIGDVFLGYPNLYDNDNPLPFPVTFNWTKRVQAPTDSYILYITEYISEPQIQYIQKYKSPLLGYVNSQQLVRSDLPMDMVSNKLYFWYITIQSPDGAVGAVSTMQGIKFVIPIP